MDFLYIHSLARSVGILELVTRSAFLRLLLSFSKTGSADVALSCFFFFYHKNVYWYSCSFQDRVWANVGKSLNCIIAMVDKLVESDGSSEGSSGGKNGEKDPAVVDSVVTHPGGKESFFPNHWLSKQNEKVMIRRDRKRGVSSAFDESADSVLFRSGLDDGGLFIKLHLRCLVSTAWNAHFFSFAT